MPTSQPLGGGTYKKNTSSWLLTRRADFKFLGKGLRTDCFLKKQTGVILMTSKGWGTIAEKHLEILKRHCWETGVLGPGEDRGHRGLVAQ